MASTTCEHGRTTAYSEEIRWRAIYQWYFLGLRLHKIALNLNIDQSTVSRILTKFDDTGSVQKAIYPKGQCHYLKKLTEIDEHLIVGVVLE